MANYYGVARGVAEGEAVALEVASGANEGVASGEFVGTTVCIGVATGVGVETCFREPVKNFDPTM